MFLHIGDNYMIPIKDIIGIFDLEATTTTKETREFLNVSEEEGFITTISKEMPKSFIVTEEDSRSRIYLSPISASTLRKRMEIWGTGIGFVRK